MEYNHTLSPFSPDSSPIAMSVSVNNSFSFFSLIISILLNSFFGIIILFLYWILHNRPSLKWIYHPSSPLSTPSSSSHPSPSPLHDSSTFPSAKSPTSSPSLFAFTPTHAASSSSPPPSPLPSPTLSTLFSFLFHPPSPSLILSLCGPDALILTRFLHYSIRLFTLCFVLSTVVIIPIHLIAYHHKYGIGDDDGNDDITYSLFDNLSFYGIDILSVSSLSSTSNMLYIHLLVLYIIHLYSIYLLYLLYDDYIFIRHNFIRQQQLSPTNPQFYTLYINNIPKYVRDDHSLRKYFSKLFPMDYVSSTCCKDLTNLEYYVKRRSYYHEKLFTLYKKYSLCQRRNLIYYRPLMRKPLLSAPSSQCYPIGYCCYHVVDILSYVYQMIIPSGGNSQSSLSSYTRSPTHSPPLTSTSSFSSAPLFSSPVVDSLSYYSHKLHKYNEFIENYQLRHKFNGLRSLKSGFLTLRTSVSLTHLLRTEVNHKPFQFHLSIAPLLDDIYWGNIGISSKYIFLRGMMSNLIVAVMVLFWSIPISVVSTLSNLHQIVVDFPIISPIVSPILRISPYLTALIEGVLPGLLASLLMIILPLLLVKLSKMEGIISYSMIEMNILQKYFIFEVINFFIIPTLTGSILREISNILLYPIHIFYYLGHSLPAASSFFISLVLVNTLIGIPMRLLRVDELVITKVKIWWKRRKLRKDMEGEIVENRNGEENHNNNLERKSTNDSDSLPLPPSESTDDLYNHSDHPSVRSLKSSSQGMEYGTLYPECLLIYLIGITYSLICPIVIPFVLLYFVFFLIYSLYSLLYVYHSSRHESGALYWPLLFRRISLCHFISQFTLIGIFLLKSHPLAAVLTVPLCVIHFIFYKFVVNAYEKKGEWLPVEQARAVDNERERRQGEAEAEQGEEKGKGEGKTNIIPSSSSSPSLPLFLSSRPIDPRRASYLVDDTTTLNPYTHPLLLVPPATLPPFPSHLLHSFSSPLDDGYDASAGTPEMKSPQQKRGGQGESESLLGRGGEEGNTRSPFYGIAIGGLPSYLSLEEKSGSKALDEAFSLSPFTSDEL